MGADKGYPHPGADKGADNQLAPHQNLKAVSSLRLNEVVSNASTVPSGAAPAARVPLLKQSAAKK